ncbi:MAG: DUF3048 domain-containing protein [Patescibacteria group bacterium]
MGKKNLNSSMEIREENKFDEKNTGIIIPGSFNWKKFCYITIISFLILLFCTVISIINFYPGLFQKSGSRFYFSEIPAQNKDNACASCVRQFLNGSFVSPEKENVYPVAVIIDNHPDARPAYGLSQADIVYEAEAEGGITRYLAIFANGEKIEKIGPVRSARPYFIDWDKELSAVFIHCGGSPEALTKIAKENIFDLNEFYNGDYFWRVKDYLAPHNIFTSSENLNKYLESKNLTAGKFLKWNFKNDSPSGEEQNDIDIAFKSPNFVVKWKYNKIKNEYARYLGGELQKDEGNGQEITAKNIIIQYQKTEILDKELRLKIDTLGSGKAIICLDGKCSPGEWKKNNSSSRTRYYYENGEEVQFNGGKFWIETVRPELQITY